MTKLEDDEYMSQVSVIEKASEVNGMICDFASSVS
jgi:hypothetical protein